MTPGGPAPTPPSTANSSGGHSPENAQFRVVRKRNRVPLSCAPCRHRKLKCNRAHPCDNCTKRGDQTSCTYAAPSARKKGGNNAGPNGTPDDMQNRIDRLESLVLSLMTSGSGSSSSTAAAQAALNNARNHSTAESSHSASASMDQDGESEMQDEDSDVNDVSQGIGVMKVDGTRAYFASDAHWHAILANVLEVKNYYASHKEDYQAQVRRVRAAQVEDAPGGSYIFQAPLLADKDEALAAIPDKPRSDALVRRYFESCDPAASIIHGPTFQKQYDAHWLHPKETPLPFIAKMFAIMSFALQSYDRVGDEPPEYLGNSMKVAAAYRRLTAQVIVLAGINETDDQVLEALVLHCAAEFGRSRDTEPGVTTLVSMAVRLAMRMGYHRDPAPYGNVSPFQGEMRRRLWMVLRQFDLLFSAQAGLPPVLRSDLTDTELPRNLFDHELYQEMQELPPSRPDDEETAVSYMIAKAKISRVFALITDRLAVVTNPMTYDEVMELDRRLREARNNHPPHLRLRPLRESVNDHPHLIMQRYALELLYLKSQCMLHRRFLGRGRDNARYTYSRSTCIDASMDLLSHQAILHRESQPGGQLHSVKWYISSLTTHDFVLAAMIICLELHYAFEHERSGRKGSAESSPMSSDLVEERKGEMLEALRHSRTIWDSLREGSVEAWKASTSIKIMLEKIMNPQAAQNGAGSGFSSINLTGRHPSGIYYGPPSGILANMNVSMVDAEREAGPEQAAAMTLGLLSSGGMSPNSSYSGSGPNSNGNAASMAGLLNEPMQDQQRSGFSPGYMGMQQDCAANAPTPFSAMWAGAGPNMFDSMTGPEIDWGAWDSFIQGSSLPTGMWPPMSQETPPATQNNPNNIDPAIESSSSPNPGANAFVTQLANSMNGAPQQQQSSMLG